ncbi:MAG: hypothetical protein WAS21_15585, partial [Geminicoccaceae bacterium]
MPSAHRCPRADAFGLLPEETSTAWTRHVLELRECYRPVDATETGLVTAIAAAMWMEIRADRIQAEVLADIRPACPGRSHGSDLQDRDHAAALSSVLRFATVAGCASSRAQRAFLAHRKARAAGLIGPALERTPASGRTSEPERGAPPRTCEPERGAPPRTGEPEKGASPRTCEPERGAPARTCEPEEGARPRTGEPERGAPCTSEPETSAPARTCEPEPAWAGPAPANDADPVDALRRRILGLLAGPG